LDHAPQTNELLHDASDIAFLSVAVFGPDFRVFSCHLALKVRSLLLGGEIER